MFASQTQLGGYTKLQQTYNWYHFNSPQILLITPTLPPFPPSPPPRSKESRFHLKLHVHIMNIFIVNRAKHLPRKQTRRPTQSSAPQILQN